MNKGLLWVQYSSEMSLAQGSASQGHCSDITIVLPTTSSVFSWQNIPKRLISLSEQSAGSSRQKIGSKGGKETGLGLISGYGISERRVFASVGWGEAIIMTVKRREIGSLPREEVKELNGNRGKVKLSRITKRFMAKTRIKPRKVFTEL